MSVPDIILVDTISLLHQCIADCQPDPLPANPAALALDLEGIKLNRYGRISIIQIWPDNGKTIWLVDVTTLQERAFNEVDALGRSLRGILEATAIRKVFFDVRNDSDALFNLYGVNLQNVYDLQLLELAVRNTQRQSTKFLNGLSKSIQTHITPPRNWVFVKDQGIALFAPEKGGSYAIFERRPLDPRLVQYCAQDVALLFKLEAAMKRKLGMNMGAWNIRIVNESRARVALARRAHYNTENRSLAPVRW